MSEVYFTEWDTDTDGDSDREVCFRSDEPHIDARMGRIFAYTDGTLDVTMYGDERDCAGFPGRSASLVEIETWAAGITRKRGEAMVREAKHWKTLENNTAKLEAVKCSGCDAELAPWAHPDGATTCQGCS